MERQSGLVFCFFLVKLGTKWLGFIFFRGGLQIKYFALAVSGVVARDGFSIVFRRPPGGLFFAEIDLNHPI